MLKKKNRLPKEARVKSGNRFSSKFFLIVTIRNGKSFSRFGFVVSKKIDKRASSRNRIKRQLRFCIEKNLDKIIEGVDMLFIARKEIVGANTKEISFCMEDIFKKEGFLK